VYYFWYEFLKRSDDYQKCCKSKGKGKLSAIYKDFGDIFNNDFKTWWFADNKGVTLFSEQVGYEFKEITKLDEIVINEQVINIQLPISHSKRTLTRIFNAFLKTRHPGSRGKRNNLISTALYPVVGKVDKFSLEKALYAYDLHKTGKYKLWEIGLQKGIQSRIRSIEEKKVGSPRGQGTNEKMILSNTVNRLLRRAEKLIKSAESGKFPNLRRVQKLDTLESLYVNRQLTQIQMHFLWYLIHFLKGIKHNLLVFS
jgi:hypothetical protein